MAKVEIFRRWYLRRFLAWWGGVFPVRRGERDIRAVRRALELIRAGLPLVLFPEGTRHPDGLGPTLPGVGYLAARAGCPVLPVGLVGTQHIRSLWALRHRPRFEVRFGEPFTVDPSLSPEAAADLVMRRVAALLPPDRRGHYADRLEPIPAAAGVREGA
jgi:1-acyl-sn-glycerol-3-phosphate acyltransferase